jgi:hypothetical protein
VLDLDLALQAARLPEKLQDGDEAGHTHSWKQNVGLVKS